MLLFMGGFCAVIACPMELELRSFSILFQRQWILTGEAVVVGFLFFTFSVIIHYDSLLGEYYRKVIVYIPFAASALGIFVMLMLIMIEKIQAMKNRNIIEVSYVY